MSSVFKFFDEQRTSAVKKHTTDFGDAIPSGASIASASTAYAQTFGGTASGSATTSVAGGSLATFTTPALSLAGQYTFTCWATLSDGQILPAIWYLTLNQ